MTEGHDKSKIRADKLRPGDARRPDPGAVVGDRKPGAEGLNPTPASGMGVSSESPFPKRKG